MRILLSATVVLTKQTAANDGDGCDHVDVADLPHGCRWVVVVVSTVGVCAVLSM